MTANRTKTQPKYCHPSYTYNVMCEATTIRSTPGSPSTRPRSRTLVISDNFPAKFWSETFI